MAPGLWREAQLWARSKALNAKVDPEHEATWRREATQGNITNLVPHLEMYDFSLLAETAGGDGEVREFTWAGAV